MRHYTRFRDMVDETKRELAEMGITYISYSVQDVICHEATKELVGYSYSMSATCMTDPDVLVVLDEHRYNISWILAEVHDRLYPDKNNLNPGRAYLKNEEFWKQFLHEGKFAYTYAERLSWQIYTIIEDLRVRPSSRQAILTMFREDDLYKVGGDARIPCSLTYQFLVREGKVHLIYNMRSCDFIKFFAADVFMAIGMLEYVAENLGLPMGTFYHNIGSLHIFEKDVKGVF